VTRPRSGMAMSSQSIPTSAETGWHRSRPTTWRREYRRGRTVKAPCDYGYVGGGFFGSGAAQAWDALIAGSVRYVITFDPAVYPSPTNVFNEALKPENFHVLWTNLTDSGFFAREAPAYRKTLEWQSFAVAISSPPGARCPTTAGTSRPSTSCARRPLWSPPTSKRGPTWRWPTSGKGTCVKRLAAGAEARRLSPTHYYVNLDLARAPLCSEAMVRGSRARRGRRRQRARRSRTRDGFAARVPGGLSIRPVDERVHVAARSRSSAIDK